MKPIDKSLKQADDILQGEGESFEDCRAALQLYQAAASLDFGKAYFKIGLLYEEIKGKSNIEKAMTAYKQVLRFNHLPASAALAVLYGKLGEIEDSSAKGGRDTISKFLYASYLAYNCPVEGVRLSVGKTSFVDRSTCIK